MRLLKRCRPRYAVLALGAMLLALVATACSAEPKLPPSSMEVVQGSYLHLNMNISDLRTRVTNWQKGDDSSLNIAKEKVERIDKVLASTGWPKEMAKSLARTKAAIAPMDRALKVEDKAAAEAASAEFGTASHDVVHEFYYTYLPAMEGMASTSMSAHAVYLDLAGNIADLQTRLESWQKGDEGSLGIAKEKAERIEILIPHLYSTGVVVKDLPPIQRALPAVFAALERKDAAASAQAARPIVEAGGVLGRDFYTWMELERAGKDPSCVQASYLEVSRSITDLRAGVTAWAKGESAGLAAATDNLARVELLLIHTGWPTEMTAGLDKTANALALMSRALKDKSVAAAEAASPLLGDGSHDITHDYYGLWLPAGGLQGAKAGTQARTQTAGSGAHSDGDAHGAQVAQAEGPNWVVIGGFTLVMALVVFGAAFTKPRATVARAGALPDGSEA